MSTETTTAGWANHDDLSASFPVLMRCGHAETRRMRPSVARAVADPDGELRSGNLCAACFAEHNAHQIKRLIPEADRLALDWSVPRVETEVRGATPVSCLAEIPKTPSREDVARAYDQCINELRHQAGLR